jgi:hypothetical protein
VVINRIGSRRSLDRAFSRIIAGGNIQYKNFFRPVYYHVEAARDDFIDDLSKRVKTDWTPQWTKPVFIPKKSGLQRRLMILSLEDQIVWQALVDDWLRLHWNRRKRVEQSVVFSNLTNDDPKSAFILRPWQESYGAFATQLKNDFHEGYRYVAHFDFAAFYDTIPHGPLIRLGRRTGSPQDIHRLRMWLSSWRCDQSGPIQHGIPQGPSASDIAAEIFLLDFDEKMQANGIVYRRYVDDIRILGDSHKEVQTAILRLERLASDKGLVAQGDKLSYRQVNAFRDVLGSNLSDVAQPGEETLLLKPSATRRLWRMAVNGRPLSIRDGRTFKFTLFRAPQDSTILRQCLRLLPAYPTMIDAFCFYFRRYSNRPSIARALRDLAESSPYDYVRHVCWKTIPFVISSQQLPNYKDAAISHSALCEEWPLTRSAALEFLLLMHDKNQGRFLSRMRTSDPLEALLVARSIGSKIVSETSVIRRFLGHRANDVGMAFMEPLLLHGQKIRGYLKVADANEEVQLVLRKYDLIGRTSKRRTDPIGRMIASHFGIAYSRSWKAILGERYEQAMRILQYAVSVYEFGGSEWLAYMDSFGDLAYHGLHSALEEKEFRTAILPNNRVGERKDYGVMLEPTQRFYQRNKVLGDGLRRAHARRNNLPSSHPLDKRSGSESMYLKVKEKREIHAQLARSYERLIRLAEAQGV